MIHNDVGEGLEPSPTLFLIGFIPLPVLKLTHAGTF